MNFKSPNLLQNFEENGYAIIENFLTEQEIESLKDECKHLVDNLNPNEKHGVFSTEKQNYRSTYFLDSADKIGYFYEDEAINSKGEIVVEKAKSLNKIGHALHVLCPSFKEITFSPKIQNVVRELKFVDPAVCQSMYIFKQPKIGGTVVPHQDATFLHADPDRVLGIWLALEDATLDNGCLWFIPGSHKSGLYGDYKMIRGETDNELTCIFTGTKPKYNEADFIATPVSKGSLVIIHGLVVHKSEANRSDRSRHIYTFHVFDRNSSDWKSENWLQLKKGCEFESLYT